MSSAAMASSSVSQEDVENDFERSSRRSRIRMARGRDVRGQHLPSAATRLAADSVAEAEDAGEPRPLDASGYSGDHDASPKPAARAKDKRPVRPTHASKGKQQRDRDRRKLREKRRSSGVVHMPSTEMSSTGGSTSEDEESLAGQAVVGAETRRVAQETEPGEPGSGGGASAALPDRHFKSPRRNKSLSDLDADDEDNNQDCDSLGPSDTPATGAVPPPPPPVLDPPAARLVQLEEENSRLRRQLAERDRRIAGLEATAERGALEHHQLRLRNDSLSKALSALTAK